MCPVELFAGMCSRLIVLSACSRKQPEELGDELNGVVRFVPWPILSKTRDEDKEAFPSSMVSKKILKYENSRSVQRFS
jgi:hypothetical protein